MTYTHKFKLDGKKLVFEVTKDDLGEWAMKWIKQGLTDASAGGGDHATAEDFAKNAEKWITYCNEVEKNKRKNPLTKV